MKRTKQVADRFREVILNGKWIANTNIQEQLADLNWQQATIQVESLNSIAALTFHIDYYIAGLINVFKGGQLEIRDKFSFDMPPVNCQEDWEEVRDNLMTHAAAFADLVEVMPDEKLDAPFVDEKYGTYLRNIEAMTEHAYYHFGQITLLKKLIQKGRLQG